MKLELCPLKRSECQRFINEYHRHHKAPVGDIFRVGLWDGERVVGCATVGRPVARHADDGWTLEINRLCVLEGHPNGASMLLGACKRAAWALGYRRLITFTLATEGGASLRAAGYRLVGERKGRTWDSPGRPRVPLNHGDKFLWEVNP